MWQAFKWQAQYLVKFGQIAGARNVVFFNRKRPSGARKVTLFARRVVEMTFQVFSGTFCQILGGHFAWQAQYLVRLEGDTCCSAHCK